jgi:Family of unknown function (DUF5675)
MKRITIKTVAQTEAAGTQSVMTYHDIAFALTLELPWRDNHPDVSCIPGGLYVCKRIVSPHFGDVFEVQNVPGRDHVLLHKANFLTDLKGCIAVGEQFAGPVDAPFLGDSKQGYDQFMGLLVGETEFELEIIRWITNPSR